MKRVFSYEDSTVGRLPFLDKAVSVGTATVGNSYEVLEVSESRNKSGFLFKTDVFMVFLFKSSELVMPLLAELEKLCRMNPAPAMYFEVTDTTVEGFCVWFDDDEDRQWVKSKKMNVLDRFSALPRSRQGSRKSSGTK